MRSSLTGALLQARRQIEHNGLTACMNILAYCATVDPLAKQYLGITKVLQNALSAVDVRLLPENVPEPFPTISDTETVDLSPQAYDCSASVWPTLLPTLPDTSVSQTSMFTTRMSYQDPIGVHVPLQTTGFHKSHISATHRPRDEPAMHR